jgi:hypothetical protein
MNEASPRGYLQKRLGTFQISQWLGLHEMAAFCSMIVRPASRLFPDITFNVGLWRIASFGG